MPEISFEFECFEPFDLVNVLANEDGSGILIIDKTTDSEIEFKDLRDSDRDRIKAKVREWVDHNKAMRDRGEPHPADEAFGKPYTDWLNKMSK